MKVGKTEKYINEKLDDEGALLFALVDPLDYPSPDAAISHAASSASSGADVVLIGGSIGAQGELLDSVAEGIKERVEVPVVLFPGNIATITRHADALYFMSLLNARNPYWITQAQMLSAPLLKKLRVEPLPVGYIVVSPGGTVGWVGDANLVPREKPQIAASLALAGEFLGNRFILTDAGSNPQLQGSSSIPYDMIRAVKSAIDVPYILGGGVNSEESVRGSVRAGADIIQIGTAIEQSKSADSKTRLFSRAIKEEGRRRRHSR